MSAGPHRIALCGAGGFARNAHLPAIAGTDYLELAAVYSRSLDSVNTLIEATKSYQATSHDLGIYSDDPSSESFDALLARSDIPTVVFALPIATQPAMVERALRAGKNVISEKPIAPSLDEAKRLIELYEREFRPKGQQWIVAEQFPWEKSYCKASEWVKAGKVGEVRSFSAEVFVQPSALASATGWRQAPDYQGGFILDGGVHFVAGLRHILPYPITSVFASASQIQPSLPPCDTLTGILTATPPASPSSSSLPITGTISFSFGTESCSTRRYVISGSKALLTVDFGDRKQHVVTLRTPPSSPDEDDPHELVVEFSQRGVEEEFDAFGQALFEGPDSEAAREVARRSGPRATLRDLGVIEGALKSSRDKVVVDLRELVGGSEWFDY
ncbi:hypothetical protein JCM10212_006151 [Sporobolomyces blumeae]